MLRQIKQMLKKTKVPKLLATNLLLSDFSIIFAFVFRHFTMDIHVFEDLDNLIDVRRAIKIYKPRREEVNRNFKSLFRFEEQNINFLVHEFLPEYQETRGGAVSNQNKMKCFLRYLGDPGFQVSIVFCLNSREKYLRNHIYFDRSVLARILVYHNQPFQ